MRHNPGKLAIFYLNSKQIATQMIFTFLVRVYVQIWHIESRIKSEGTEFEFLAFLQAPNFFLHISVACNDLIVNMIVVCFIS